MTYSLSLIKMSGYDRALKFGPSHADKLPQQRGIEDPEEQRFYRLAFMAGVDAAEYLSQQRAAHSSLTDFDGKFYANSWEAVHRYTQEGLIEREEALNALKSHLFARIGSDTASIEFVRKEISEKSRKIPGYVSGSKPPGLRTNEELSLDSSKDSLACYEKGLVEVSVVLKAIEDGDPVKYQGLVL